jgi:hypothetical protein
LKVIYALKVLSSCISKFNFDRTYLLRSIGLFTVFGIFLYQNTIFAQERESRFETLIEKSETIALVDVQVIERDDESYSLSLSKVRVLKGELTEEMLYPDRSFSSNKPPQQRINGTRGLAFFGFDDSGKIELTRLSHYEARSLDDFFMWFEESVWSELPTEWCESSLTREVACMGASLLFYGEASSFGSVFIGISLGDRSEDLLDLWEQLRKSSEPHVRMTAFEHLLVAGFTSRVCELTPVFGGASKYHLTVLAMMLRGSVRTFDERTLRCVGDMALNKSVPPGVRRAAAACIHAIHSPNSISVLEKLLASDEEMLQKAGILGVSKLATGEPPERMDVSGLSPRIWRFEARAKNDESLRDNYGYPETSKEAFQERLAFWRTWLGDNKQRIQRQVEETRPEIEALERQAARPPTSQNAP